MGEKTKFFLYCRKSTDDRIRQQSSIEDQQAEGRAMADREGLEVVGTFVERKSAKVPGRPVFNEMLDRIEKGEASGIIAWHPDRLSRNALDSGRLSFLVDTGRITDLLCPTYRFERNAAGKLHLNMLFSQSQYYINSLSENIQRGKRHRAQNGYWPSPIPAVHTEAWSLQTTLCAFRGCARTGEGRDSARRHIGGLGPEAAHGCG
jgi:site-specific DNA recombinase